MTIYVVEYMYMYMYMYMQFRRVKVGLITV